MLESINLNAGITGNQLDICYGDTVNLFDGISNYDLGGVWTQEIPTVGLQDSLFVSGGLASTVFNFTYTLLDERAVARKGRRFLLYGTMGASVIAVGISAYFIIKNRLRLV